MGRDITRKNLALITESHGGGVKATLRVRGPQKLVAIFVTFYL